MNIPVQLLGVLGLCASVAAFQCKKHKPIVLLRTLNELAFGLQY
ncbi:MAG: YgjV family protein, partial [Oscillospiraceae bacterium]|nr:YgjV family protein [Oscillospiraceae bacterium]